MLGHAMYAIKGIMVLFLLCVFVLSGCGGGGGSDAASSTSGPSFQAPATSATAQFSKAVVSGRGAAIDTSSVADGYVAAEATSSSRLKFQVTKGDVSYNYDMPNNGTPVVCPINMGNGLYNFRVMQNTSGSNYVELLSTDLQVNVTTEFEPFIRPNVFCSYTDQSAVAAKARELAQGAENEGDVARSIYTWMKDNITYDKEKAKKLSSSTGYIPNPDETLSSGTGICFDYASLAAAMFRSLGIPCKIITGYVAPDDIYHAWNMIYIDGKWESVEITVNPDTWTRIDTTFAASGADSEFIGDGSNYTDRYVY